MGHIEDRWTRPTGSVDSRGRPIRSRTARYGQGKRWVATWTDAGKRRALSFDTRDAAVAHLSNVVVDQRAGTYVSPHKQTFGEYGDEWVKAQIHQRDSSAEQMEIRWRLHIRPRLGNYLLTEMTRQHVQAAVGYWATEEPGRKALAPSTIEVTYGYVASIMKAAVADRLVRSSPCGKQINLPANVHEKVKPLTVAQVDEIAERIGTRYVGMVWLGAATGLRGGELRGLTDNRLRWHDDGSLTVRIDRQLVTTAPKWGPPKTGTSDRSVSIDPQSAAKLRVHLDTYEPHSSGLIFTGRNGGPLARTSAATAWNAATDGMALPGRSGWHMLRHFHASLLIAAGISVTAVADRLGHQDSTETLRTYAHLWPNDEARSRDAIAAGLWG